MSTKKHDVSDAMLASLLADYQKPEDLIGENGPLKQLTKPWSRGPSMPKWLGISLTAWKILLRLRGS